MWPWHTAWPRRQHSSLPVELAANLPSRIYWKIFFRRAKERCSEGTVQGVSCSITVGGPQNQEVQLLALQYLLFCLPTKPKPTLCSLQMNKIPVSPRSEFVSYVSQERRGNRWVTDGAWGGQIPFSQDSGFSFVQPGTYFMLSRTSKFIPGLSM